jgi:hypothetical protein
MADEARPLSRRERREMEEQAAAGHAPAPAESTAPADWDNPVVEAVDASGLTRRDRRRLERLEQPMETWTAVEEMHHTGQVPTMTPEVIAQQEELARRRAAEAQADARLATGEIHQVAAHQALPDGISRYEMPDEAPEPPRPAQSGPGDDARRRLAQAAAEAAAQLPSDRERPSAPVRQEHGVIDAPRPMTAEVPSLADLTPPSGIRSAPNPVPQGAPAPPPQQGLPGQAPPYPPTGSVPTGSIPAPYPLGASPTPYPGAPVGQPGAPVGQPGAPVGQPGAPVGQPGVPQQASPPNQAPPRPAVAGQVMPGAPQGAFGVPPPPTFGPPTGATPMPGGPSAYPPGTALSPIVTGMLRPVPGATGTMRAIPGAGPMTGTIPRPIVEVQPAGGAKEFGWPHIALLAAAAFVLGLVVWKISGLGG